MSSSTENQNAILLLEKSSRLSALNNRILYVLGSLTLGLFPYIDTQNLRDELFAAGLDRESELKKFVGAKILLPLMVVVACIFSDNSTIRIFLLFFTAIAWCLPIEMLAAARKQRQNKRPVGVPKLAGSSSKSGRPPLILLWNIVFYLFKILNVAFAGLGFVFSSGSDFCICICTQMIFVWCLTSVVHSVKTAISKRSNQSQNLAALVSPERTVELVQRPRMSRLIAVIFALFGLWALLTPNLYGFYVGVPVLFCVFTSFRERKIEISSEGIRLFTRRQFMRTSKQFLWHQLESVVIDRKRRFFRSPSERLKLHLGSTRVDFDLNMLSPQQRFNLFLVLSKYANPSKFSGEALYLQASCLAGRANASSEGFTQMWLDDYNSNFHRTSHATLKPSALVADRFTIVRLLSTRMNQSVYLAQSALGELLVLKELIAGVGANGPLEAKMQEHFAREASILAGLKHPHIVKIRDHFVNEHRGYIVMDYIRGKSLRTLMREEKSIAFKQLLSIASQVAALLEHLHAQTPPIVHRDVSPENLLWLEDEGAVWLIDFGASNFFDADVTATVVGKEPYMPPEQIRGKAEPASDIYAFGGLLYFLNTGADPMPLSGDASLSDERMRSLIECCWNFEPSRRPSWTEIFKAIEKLKEPELQGTNL